MNERCLELRKAVSKKKDDEEDEEEKKRKKGRCEFYGAGKVRDFSAHILSEIQDIEGVVGSGEEAMTCPYYSTRVAVPEAEIVLLPYNMILHGDQRRALNVKLRDAVVVIDEAHNLIETINEVHSCTLRAPDCTTTHKKLSIYLRRVKARLKPENLLRVKQILHCVGLLSSFLRAATTTKLYTIGDFQSAAQLGDLNLFELVEYIRDSHLSQKIQGYNDDVAGVVTVQSRSILSDISTFFLSLTHANSAGRVLVVKDEVDHFVRYISLNCEDPFLPLLRDCRAVILAGGTMEPIAEIADVLYRGGCWTQSVRSGLYTADGKEVTSASSPLTLYNPHPDHYEQDCREIWEAVCTTVRHCTTTVGAGDIGGIGFDATCSMVVVGRDGEPLPIGQHTCLLWMDHRAVKERDVVNSTRSPVLDYVGGGFSPEQQPPKLLWLKNNLPETWEKAEHFFGLPDWLTYKATGRPTRSICSVTCKWGYVASRGGWDKDFLDRSGLGDIGEKLGSDVAPPGSPITGGLSEGAARELGLQPGITVGVRGRSAWHVVIEGGQTAAGSALDRIAKGHPAYKEGTTYNDLNAQLRGDLTCPTLHRRTTSLHIQPDLHGNRAPLADPAIRGMISGLELSRDTLLDTYLAAIQGLALGVRFVLEALYQHGLTFNKVLVSGGMAHNELYLVTLATVTKLPVEVPPGDNMMCAGSAMLGAGSTSQQCGKEGGVVYQPITELSVL
eukprot:sb/3462491/